MTRVCEVCGSEKTLENFYRKRRTCRPCVRTVERERYGPPERSVWKSMWLRCTKPAVDCYHLYGGRGIRVCEAWRDFDQFLRDVGPRPSPKHQLDRKDNDGNYEPGNVRWATAREQGRNRRTNVWVDVNGRTVIAKDAAPLLGLTISALRHRLRRGLIAPVAPPTANQTEKKLG